MSKSSSLKAWARQTVANGDYLPWADVRRAKQILGLPLSEEPGVEIQKPASKFGDSLIYIDGAFFDRVSNEPEDVAHSLNLEMERVETFPWFGGVARKVFLRTPA